VQQCIDSDGDGGDGDEETEPAQASPVGAVLFLNGLWLLGRIGDREIWVISR
jgi:hypothetical protein